MSLTFVQLKATAGGANPSVTLDATPTQGNLLVAWVWAGGYINDITGWTKSHDGSYSAGGPRGHEVWWKVAGASESTTVLFNVQSNGNLIVAEFGGGTWTAPDDTDSVTAFTGSSTSAPSITPTSDRQAVIVIAYWAWDTARTTTWPDGYTERWSGAGGDNTSELATMIVDSTSGSYDGTVSGMSTWGNVIGTYAFIADAGGGGGGARSFGVIVT